MKFALSSIVLISIPATTASGGGVTQPGSGAAAKPDKGSYHLFNPTPRSQMREMSTDRPDTTESAYTVDAGRFQLEASLYDFSRTGEDRTHTFGSLNLKAGLLNCMDVQMVFDSYAREEGGGETRRGFGDVIVRLKTNLWGNDGGRTALAVMPFVKIPTGAALSNDEWEGGIIVPFALEVSERFSFGAMLEADFVSDGAGGYDTEWVHTATVGISLTEKLGMFVEYAGVSGGGEGFEYQASANVGFTFSLTDDLILDAGARFGLNDAAEDFGAFAGLSVRF